MSRILITGTDTGIGKTTVASAIAAALARRGHAIGVIKPAETGCESDGDGLRAADAEQLRYFARSEDPIEAVCPFRLRAPLAPAIAARREGMALDLPAVVAAVERIVSRHATTLVEGAGGLLVPLAGSASFADLARACRLRLVVVVGNRLGALNHAQLTMRVAESAGLATAGYIVNTLQPAVDIAARTNVDVLHELLGPPLGVFPWVGAVQLTDAERDRLADVAERTLDLDALL
jgi:dethiobiotin synthetase